MMNQTVIMEFLLLRFTENQLLLRLHAVFLLLIYLLAIVENLIIILLTILDQHLHTPMYFFLRHLPFLDMCLISATVPKSILNSIAFTDSISFLGCVLQFFLVILMFGSEISILTAMSYDHYIAICRPLHYKAVMSKEVCVQLVLVSWLSGGVFGVLYSAGTFSLNFCGSTKIHQLFCDVPALLKLTCSVEHATINVSVAIGVCYGFSCLVCIVVSYVHVFSTVLKIPTRQKQGKAFSTCLPHLFGVSPFLLTGAIAYLKPNSDEPSLPDLFVSMFYSVVPPTLNPVIYCLRRKDIKLALVKVLWRLADYFTGKLNIWASTVSQMPEDIQHGKTSRGLRRLQVAISNNKFGKLMCGNSDLGQYNLKSIPAERVVGAEFVLSHLVRAHWPSEEAAVLQVVLDDEAGESIKHQLHVLGVNSPGEACIDHLGILALVQFLRLILDVAACLVILVGP
ncbi:olfactory receptor 14K1 [Mirounga leonina]|uniref:olfactory receptor 14K1 n=1 Tax=Mirounga leonina TaxID=9715 RepID=UPI00156C0F0F|nr:olfactory receptor 14K1 [Mirounga leonina]